jgi:plasmid stabilization system protein ParE
MPPPRFQVIFEYEAQMEALDAAAYIAQNSPQNARQWYEGLERAIDSLEILPMRYGLAPESEYLGVELRHYLYKSYRIIYRVEEAAKTVRILHVRHGHRRAIGEPVDPDDASE